MSAKVEWPVIGIDLGTTYSCVAVWRDDRVEIIPNEQGNHCTPSCIAFAGFERLIGEPAVGQTLSNPTNAVFDAKRLIGRRFSDDVVQEDMKRWPFKVIDGTNLGRKDMPLIIANYMGEEKSFTPEEISAMILTKMKDVAEGFLGSTVKNAIITVPAYFNDSQRQATKDAGSIAGLNVVRIINEPTAAAMAYGLDMKINQSNGPKKNVLVFDLGGGTFDVSLVAMEKGKISVEAVSGDTHLGGADFDNRMVLEFVEEFKMKHNKDISKNPRALARLRTASEGAKRRLSSTPQTDVGVDCLHDGIDFSSTVTRARFENLNMDLFCKCIVTVSKCLEDADMQKSNVHDVVLIGGSSRIPKLRQMLQDFFDGKELYKSRPYEAVAYGAALHAAIISGVSHSYMDIVLADVTPLSLGIRADDDKMSVVIPRSTTIPTKKNHTYHTAYDNHTNARFILYEGEGSMVKDNHYLDEFSLSGIPPVPEGATTFDVYFEIDINGILNVSAEVIMTGKMEQITIVNNRVQLSEEEIERMIKKDEMYKTHEKKYHKMVQAKLILKNYANQMLNVLQNCTDLNISEYKKNNVKEAIDKTFEWLDEKTIYSVSLIAARLLISSF